MKPYPKNSRVTHASYGAGTITSADETYTIIEFDDHGRRVFMTDMVALSKTDIAAPAKKTKEKKAAKRS